MSNGLIVAPLISTEFHPVLPPPDPRDNPTPLAAFNIGDISRDSYELNLPWVLTGWTIDAVLIGFLVSAVGLDMKRKKEELAAKTQPKPNPN